MLATLKSVLRAPLFWQSLRVTALVGMMAFIGFIIVGSLSLLGAFVGLLCAFFVTVVSSKIAQSLARQASPVRQPVTPHIQMTIPKTNKPITAKPAVVPSTKVTKAVVKKPFALAMDVNQIFGMIASNGDIFGALITEEDIALINSRYEVVGLPVSDFMRYTAEELAFAAKNIQQEQQINAVTEQSLRAAELSSLFAVMRVIWTYAKERFAAKDAANALVLESDLACLTPLQQMGSYLSAPDTSSRGNAVQLILEVTVPVAFEIFGDIISKLGVPVAVDDKDPKTGVPGLTKRVELERTNALADGKTPAQAVIAQLEWLQNFFEKTMFLQENIQTLSEHLQNVPDRTETIFYDIENTMLYGKTDQCHQIVNEAKKALHEAARLEAFKKANLLKKEQLAIKQVEQEQEEIRRRQEAVEAEKTRLVRVQQTVEAIVTTSNDLARLFGKTGPLSAQAAVFEIKFSHKLKNDRFYQFFNRERLLEINDEVQLGQILEICKNSTPVKDNDTLMALSGEEAVQALLEPLSALMPKHVDASMLTASTAITPLLSARGDNKGCDNSPTRGAVPQNSTLLKPKIAI